AIGCVALEAGDTPIAALRDGLYRLDLANSRHTKLANAPYNAAEERFNDGRCDAAGRFWIGRMHEPRRPEATLFCYDSAQGFQARVQGVTVSNGLAFSPDGRVMYHADTPTHRVTAYDFDASNGALSNPRPFIDLSASQERPDGA